MGEEMVPMTDPAQHVPHETPHARSDTPQDAPTDLERDLRREAVKRLEDRRGLTAHVLAYVLVNLMLVVIWYATGAGFFWPLFPLLGWGIGLVFHVWSVVSPEPTESRIHEEMERLRRRP
jgi:hypothetical protein